MESKKYSNVKINNAIEYDFVTIVPYLQEGMLTVIITDNTENNGQRKEI